jgi:hypothetical protein
MRRFASCLAAIVTPVAVAVLGAAASAQSQTEYSNSLLNTKSIFTKALAKSLSELFVGVTTTAGKLSGLFPIVSTGVTTAPIKTAAESFLRSIDTIALGKVQFAVDDPEWRNWSNVDVGIFPRYGLSLEEMNESQKSSAWALIEASLSTRGLENVRKIMRTEQRLLELNAEPIRYGEEKYYLTVMGIPDEAEPWGWQLDGHHLVINFFVLGDQVVMTPAFWGGEPVTIEGGRYRGSTILQQEQNVGLLFAQSFSHDQLTKATTTRLKDRNNQVAAANADNLLLDYAGLKGSDLSTVQRVELLRLIELYIGNMKDGHSQVTMAQIAQHLDDTYFSWVGETDPAAVFYYRIHSPVILIEFDHQNPVGTTDKNQPGVPSRDHIHTVVRTPNGNDYGKDLLAAHLRQHPH